jgi:hypothetical protein
MAGPLGCTHPSPTNALKLHHPSRRDEVQIRTTDALHTHPIQTNRVLRMNEPGSVDATGGVNLGEPEEMKRSLADGDKNRPKHVLINKFLMRSTIFSNNADSRIGVVYFLYKNSKELIKFRIVLQYV